jgi:hypothetical protein
MSIAADLFPILTTAISILQSRKDFKTQADYLHANRVQLEPFIFEALRNRYWKHFQEFWNQPESIPKESDRAIVIVERRCHPNLQFVLQNSAYFCRGWAIHIVCSHANLEFVRHIVSPHKDAIHIHPYFDGIGTADQGKHEYNQLLQSREFWCMFQEDYILTLETDCYFLKPFSESILAYDYVASKWPWDPEAPGGGGLSVRKRSAMLRICDECPTKNEMQDSFVSNGVRQLGLKTPTEVYFTEAAYSYDAIGTHQWWTYLTQRSMVRLDTLIEEITHHCRLFV